MSPVSRNRKKTSRSFQGGGAGRVSNREMRRRAASAIIYGRQAYSTLLAVLAQSGGEVKVTQGTLDQVDKNYDALGFVVVHTDKAGEFIVRMTETHDMSKADDSGTKGAEETPSPELTIKTIEEEPVSEPV